MKKGYSFYKKIGMTSMEVLSKKIDILDEFHAMARVHWRSNFFMTNDQKKSIEFENIFFTQTRDGRQNVFA